MNELEIRRDTVAKVLALLQIEGCDFHHNEPNDYGYIKATLYTGKGPARRFRGEEKQARYWDGSTRGNGLFGLNTAAVDFVLAQIGREL